MKNSIVNIESANNNSFGTGFVINTDRHGIYILTCQHVLDDVVIPIVDNILAKVVARGDFIDMAVLYVAKIKLPSLSMQIGDIHNLNVEVIGFSTFNKTLTQKKHIRAILYEEPIELHSKKNDEFYTVHKIKANDGFTFDRGNSGSPVICKSSGSVIAMVSNKEGSDLAYAINIENLKTIWKDVPSKLFHKSKKKSSFIQSKKSSFTKYIITFTIFILGAGIYTFIEKFPSHTISQKFQNIYTLYTSPSEDKQGHIEDIKQAKLKQAREAEEAIKQAKLKRARESELEDIRQAKLKRAREAELEDIRQAKLKRAREAELEDIRQAKLKRAREAELEDIRQAKIKRDEEAKREKIKQAKLNKKLEKNLPIQENSNYNSIEKAKILNDKGEEFYHNNQFEKAIISYTASLQLNPYDGQTYSNLGLAYQRAGQDENAIWANLRAVEVASGEDKNLIISSALYNTAKLYEKYSQWNNALLLYEKALLYRDHKAYHKGIKRMEKKLNY